MPPLYVQPSPAKAGTARLDLCAAGLSTLCLAHCLGLPLLVTLMPLAAHSTETGLGHRMLVLAAVPVSLRAIWKALPVDGNGPFIAAAFTGLGLLVLTAFTEALSAYAEPLTVTGGALLASAHLWHWARHRGHAAIRELPIEADEP